ncbi:hypothetical protein GOBAR_AA06698 [Gossypium barbadense]|uniref:Reverse transcriptase domain-containing protein n=1 Tax=Gossypium barbadense TaxID=3634 RepID=A0A2P5YE73_GOSBA|nr:hypothetical protein GOBAR_AA06698 [Gossypium barbadense]
MGLEEENGHWVSSNVGMLQLALRFFENLFSASNSGHDERLLGLVEKQISHSMNEKLLRPFLEVDIKHAIMAMTPLKAPGIDGFPAVFIRNVGILLTLKSPSTVCQS